MITAKQEIFVQGKVDGLSHVDAYKRAYKTANMASATINVEACRLADNPNIAPVLLERQKAVIEETVKNRAWDLERIVDEFGQNVIIGREVNDKGIPAALSASNGAITGIGKALGLLNDKVDVNITHTLKPGLSLEELEERMGRLEALEAGIIDGESEIVE